MGAKEL
jgi:hypothetical protein